MMIETDLIWMSLCIFLPTAFAIILLFFPKGSEEYMRWWSLLGTCVTFVISMILFIDYLGMLDARPDKTGARPDPQTTLVSRAEAATKQELAGQPRSSEDSIARWPWIRAFNIDYFLGIDGISMPLILLTTVLFVVSMIASWNITKYVKGYCALFLLLETGVLGSFLALDFFL